MGFSVAFVVKFSVMKPHWPLWHHFVLTVVLGITFAFFYSIALAWDTARPVTTTENPGTGPPPFQVVLDPPRPYDLLPIPMEGK